MEYWLYPHEVAEFAAELEDKQAKFYSLLAKHIDQPLMNEIMGRVARQEETHATTFRAIARSNANETEKFCWHTDVRRIFMSLVIKLETFFTQDVKDAPPKELIKMGLQFSDEMETFSILMCRRIREAYPETFARMIDTIVSHEKKHVRLFENLIERLDNGTLFDARPAWRQFLADAE